MIFLYHIFIYSSSTSADDFSTYSISADDFPTYSMVYHKTNMTTTKLHGHHQRCQDSCGEALPAADGGDLALPEGTHSYKELPFILAIFLGWVLEIFFATYHKYRIYKIDFRGLVRCYCSNFDGFRVIMSIDYRFSQSVNENPWIDLVYSWYYHCYMFFISLWL